MTRMANQWTAKAVRNIHVITFEKSLSEAGPQYILLTGDRHWDNPHSKRKLQKQHLEMAKERNAPIIDIGDFFCAMQGKYDPRRSYENLREEHKGEDYLGLLLDTAEDWFAPYAGQFALIGTGNHETAVLKNNGLDLTRQLARKLRRHSEQAWPFAGAYGGYVRISVRPSGNTIDPVTIKYFHGAGGGGPVTKGVIQTNRRAVYLPDADVVVTGHIHEQWMVTLTQERVNKAGTVQLKNQYHVCVPTYKDEWNNGAGGFHVERGRPPKPVGCVWMKLTHRLISKGRHKTVVSFEIGE
jgi:hypothetical protein